MARSYQNVHLQEPLAFGLLHALATQHVDEAVHTELLNGSYAISNSIDTDSHTLAYLLSAVDVDVLGGVKLQQLGILLRC